MKNIIKEYEGIILRYTNEKDLEFVINAERDIENARYVGQWSREDHINSFSNKDIIHIIIEDAITFNSIGYIIMTGIENPNNSIEFKRFVICKKDKGFGKIALKLIKEYAFDELDANRLWLDVRHKNYRAQNVYKSQGFKEEGVLRECILYNESYESLIIMSMLKSEYIVKGW